MNYLITSKNGWISSVMLIILVIGVSCLSNQSTETGTVSDFEYVLYDGVDTPINLSDSYGAPIILNFWAGLCPPCRAEMPDFQEFYEEHLSLIHI